MALRISEAVLSGVSTWRDYELHRAREKVQADNHNAEMKLMRDHHAKEEFCILQLELMMASLPLSLLTVKRSALSC